MLFKKSEHKKRSGGIGGIFRLFLSLIIMAILGIGLLQAYRHFSGINPLTISPGATLKSLFTSEGAYKFLTGLLTVSPSDSLGKAKESLLGTSLGTDQNTSEGNSNRSKGTELYKFAVVADSHIDTASLGRALAQAKAAGVKFVIGIGDFSDVGTVAELTNTKAQFDSSGLTYYIIPGDRDLWDSRNKSLASDQNFRDIFGQPSYQTFSYENTRFFLVYNTDNYLGLDDLQLKWVEDELNRVQSTDQASLTLAFVGSPLYHPSSDRVMGKLTPKLKNQADHLASLFKKNGVDEILAGDAHFYSKYTDPEEDLPMTVVGAVTSITNAQAPRFAMVDVYPDGGYNITDTEIK